MSEPSRGGSYISKDGVLTRVEWTEPTAPVAPAPADAKASTETAPPAETSTAPKSRKAKE